MTGHTILIKVISNQPLFTSLDLPDLAESRKLFLGGELGEFPSKRFQATPLTQIFMVEWIVVATLICLQLLPIVLQCNTHTCLRDGCKSAMLYSGTNVGSV